MPRRNTDQTDLQPRVKKLSPEAMEEKAYLAPPTQKGDSKNADLIAHVMQTLEIARSVDTEDIESMQNALRAYLQLCMQTNTKITNQAVYNALGVGRSTISMWLSGQRHGDDPRYKRFAETVKAICTQYREQALVEGLINPAVGIWHQKQYDGMEENPKSEQYIDSASTERREDPEEIARRYRHLVDTESEERLEEERRKRDVRDSLYSEEGDID